MEKRYSVIKIKGETKKRLDALKLIEQESYNCVIERILNKVEIEKITDEIASAMNNVAVNEIQSN